MRGDYEGLYDRIQEKYPDVDLITESDIDSFIYHGVRGEHTVKWGFRRGVQRYRVVTGKPKTPEGKAQVRKIWEYAQKAQKKYTIEELPPSKESWDFGTKNIWYNHYEKNYLDTIREAVSKTRSLAKLKEWDRFEDPDAAKIIKDKIMELKYTEGEKLYIETRQKIFEMDNKLDLLSLEFDTELLSKKQIKSLERAREQRLKDLEG